MNPSERDWELGITASRVSADRIIDAEAHRLEVIGYVEEAWTDWDADLTDLDVSVGYALLRELKKQDDLPLGRRVAELEAAIQSAMDELGPGADEVSDSPANRCFAVLLSALTEEK